jgi:DNA-binding CsgD family transcriptional regulator
MPAPPDLERPSPFAADLWALVAGLDDPSIPDGPRPGDLRLPWTAPDLRPPALSPREREVITHIAQGMTAPQIAQAMGITVNTVESHKRRIFRRWGVTNQSQAVRLAVQLGVVLDRASAGRAARSLAERRRFSATVRSGAAVVRVDGPDPHLVEGVASLLGPPESDHAADEATIDLTARPAEPAHADAAAPKADPVLELPGAAPRTVAPVVVILDPAEPAPLATLVARHHRARAPRHEAAVLVASRTVDAAHDALAVLDALAEGIVAVVDPGAGIDGLRSGIAAAAVGRVGFTITEVIDAARAARPAVDSAHARLTPRELDLLAHLTRGHSTKQIAAALGVAPRTVDNQLRMLYRTLGVRRRAEAVTWAMHR